MVSTKNNTYYLRVLYPSSNRHCEAQMVTKEVKASFITFEGNTLQFYKYTGKGYDRNLVAVYPQTYTVIEKIIEEK